MKVQIKSLRAVNCGPLRDVHIDFTSNGEPRPITLLAGANGSGKTTVLELIASVSRLVTYLNRKADVIQSSPDSILERAEHVELIISADDAEICLAYERASVSKWQSPTLNSLKVTGTSLHSGGRERGEIIKSLRKSIDFQEDESISRLLRLSREDTDNPIIGSIIYLPYLRHLPPTRGERMVREETMYEWIHETSPANQFEGSLDSYLIWLEYAETELYSQLIEFLNSLEFDGKTFGVVRKELKAIVTTRDGQTHDVALLSSGEQNLLIMLLELRRRLLPNSIVLIDEIENSLHPAFQHKLGSALKKMQQEIPFQLIATSHSPEFLKIFGAENTISLTEL